MLMILGIFCLLFSSVFASKTKAMVAPNICFEEDGMEKIDCDLCEEEEWPMALATADAKGRKGTKKADEDVR